MTRYYSMEELEAFGPLTTTNYTTARAVTPSAAKYDLDDNKESLEPVPIEPIVAGCNAVRTLVATPDGQTYDQWMTTARVMSKCTGGEHLFHQHSRADTRYNAAETQLKFDEAKNNMSPPTCMWLRDSIGLDACGRCAVQHKVHSPMAFGHMETGIAKILGEFAFDVSTQRFFSLTSHAVYTEKSFQARYGHVPKKGSIPYIFVTSSKSGKVERAVFKPGDHRRIFETALGHVLNLWRPGGVDAVPGTWPTLQRHFSLLIPNDEEREHVLNYLASLVQRMGVKILHALLIIGDQGIGKSVLGALVKALVGDHNVYEIPPDQADTRFRSAWGNRQVLILEELMMGDRLQFQNEIKPWITQEECQVEEKHVPVHTVTTPRGWLAFSNLDNPTILARDDRRFHVIRSPLSPQGSPYYNTLWGALVTEAPAFKHFLLERDLSGFNPSAPPPVTEAKRDMIASSLPPVQIEVASMIEDGVGPFYRDLFTLSDAERWLGGKINGRLRRSVVIAALKACGCVQLGNQVPLKDGSKPRLWIARNHARWSSSEAEAIRIEMTRLPV